MDGFIRLLCTLVLAVAVAVPVAPSTATAFKHQTDLLNFGRFGYLDGSTAEFPVTGFQYDARVNQSASCTDDKTCNGPVRDLESFVWFTPITTNIGVTDYALHGGPARGGSGSRHEGITSWYIDWSGYEAGGLL